MYIVTASYSSHDDFNFWNVALYNSADLADQHAKHAQDYNELALMESRKLVKDSKKYEKFWDNFENPWDLACQYHGVPIHYSVEEIEIEDE